MHKFNQMTPVGAISGNIFIGGGLYNPLGVHFANTTELGTQLTGSSPYNNFTGLTDGQKGTMSFWIKFSDPVTDGALISCFYLNNYVQGNPNIQVAKFNEGPPYVIGIHLISANGTLMAGPGTTNFNFDSNMVWANILTSWDLSVPTMQIYVNDVSDYLDYSAPIVGTMEYSQLNQIQTGSGGQRLIGDLADVYINLSTFIDFTVTGNRRKFIDGSGNAVNLGVDGSLPTGTQPEFFYGGIGATTTSWITNLGSTGSQSDFIVETGLLTGAATNPP